MKKLLFTLILATICGISAFAYDFSAVCESGQTLFYNITSNVEPYTVEVTRENTTEPYYTTYPEGNLAIPESVSFNAVTYSVTNIGDSAFYGCSGLSGILTFPNSVTSIGNQAFYNCSGLTSVIIPNSVTTIGEKSFMGCSGLTGTLTIHKYITQIGSHAFTNCGMTTVNFNAINCQAGGFLFSGSSSFTTLNIGDSVTQLYSAEFGNCTNLSTVNYNAINCTAGIIPSPTFYNCSSLAVLNIGENVTNIPNYAFSGCSGLSTINYNATNCAQFGNYNGISGNTHITTLTIGENVQTIPNSAFSGCSGLSGALTIPNSVTSIGSSAFKNCSRLTSINIPDLVTEIESETFSGCSGLTGTLTIPNSVTSIGSSAFKNCSGLTSINIPDLITEIESETFSGCSGLTSVTIPNYVTSIGNNAFASCSGLTTVNFNATNCTTMGGYNYPVFRDCTSLSTLNIGENVTNIPEYAFFGCSGLTTVNFNATNCTSVGSNVWNGCTSLSTLNIGDNVTNIPNNAFYTCSGLTSVTIPNSVTNIGAGAFSDCSGLTSVTIPNSVTGIGSAAFYGCSGLTSVTIPDFVESIEYAAFFECNGLTTVNYNATNCISTDPLFEGCTSLSTLNIGENVTNIPSYAFEYCSGLTSITIPNSVTSIGEGAFSGCSGLTSITIPFVGGNADGTNNGNSKYFGYIFGQDGYDGGTIVQPSTSSLRFYIPSNLSSVTVGGGTIAASAFGNCSMLTEITLGNSSSTIGSGAFENCTSLVSVTIGDSVASIHEYAFDGCSGLETIVVNSGNTIYDSRENCNAIIETATNKLVKGCINTIIPNSVTCIGNSAYDGCLMTTINIPVSVTNIEANAFYHCSMLNSVTIPESVVTIGGAAFYGCSGLTMVNFNAPNCATMGSYSYPVFNGCTSLATLNIGENVTNIPNYAFSNCSRLTSITSSAVEPPQSGTGAFHNVSAIIPVYVPCGAVQAYQNAGEWSIFTNIQAHQDAVFPYIAEVQSDNPEFGSVEITHNPDCNEPTFSVQATPIEHYHFVSWSDGSTEPSLSVVVTQDTVLVASFAIDQHTMFVNSDNEDMGGVTGFGICDYNSSHEITAEPNYGYHFTNWNDGNTDNPRVVNVLSDTLFTAYFDNNEYEIVAESANEDMGTVDGGFTYRYLDWAILNANANDGYIFVRWNDGNTENPRFVTVERDSTFTATFGILNEMTITDCNNYDLGGGYNFHETGTHYGFFTNAEGVDSVVRLNLTIEQPMETSIRVVATNENNKNVVTWNPVSNNTMLGYLMYRQDAYGQYEVVDTVSIDAECSWTDEVSNTAVRPYRYAVATYDSCGNVSAMSDSHRTIHLQISLGQGNSRNLLWTDYEGIEFSTYRVYRGTSIDDMEMIMEMSRENHTYTDFNTEQDYYYQIEIVQGRSVIISRSNIVSSNPNAIETEQMSAEIALFPNPVTDILNITSSEPISEIEIVNVMGQVVKRIEVNSDNAVCNVEDLKSGVYVVRIRTLRQAQWAVISQRKFVKE